MNDALTSLNERERETLRLLLAGHDAKSISREHRLSVHTVNERLRAARRKLGVSSSREAARLLAQAEGQAPDFPAPKEFGMDRHGEGVARTAPTGPLSWPRRHLWRFGGVLLMILAIAAAFLLANGTGEIPPPRDTAEQAARSPSPSLWADSESLALDWLHLVDQQKWSESWRKAGTIFRSQISGDDWASAIVPVRKPLGAVLSRALASATRAASLPGAPEGEYEILVFQTDFAARKGAKETVVLAREPTGWGVSGYFIR